MSDYYCPHCGADLDKQSGFDPDAGYWTCTECGQFLTDPEDPDPSDRYDGVGWFCDGCGAYLNKQSGFSDWYSTWICTECGHVNNISEDEIYESADDYQNRKLSESDGDDGYGYEEEWQYDNPRRCSCCDRLLNKQDEYEDWLGGFTCKKCGYYNIWSNDEDDDSEEDYEYESGGSIDFDLEKNKRLRETEEQKQEEENRVKKEKKRERLKRIWRTITRKKQDVGISSVQCHSMFYGDVIAHLEDREFYNITTTVIEDLLSEQISQEGCIESIVINGESIFDETTKFPFNAQIDVVYHMLQKVAPPLTQRGAKKKNIKDVAREFSDVGFVNIERIAIPDLII